MSSASWKRMKPKSEKSRKTMKKKYGSKCFLDKKRLKYPICNKTNGKINCNGINGANYYININLGKELKKEKKDKTKINKYMKLKRKTKKLYKKYCKK